MVCCWEWFEGGCVGGRDVLWVVEQYLAVGICFGNALPGLVEREI